MWPVVAYRSPKTNKERQLFDVNTWRFLVTWICTVISVLGLSELSSTNWNDLKQQKLLLSQHWTKSQIKIEQAHALCEGSREESLSSLLIRTPVIWCWRPTLIQHGLILTIYICNNPILKKGLTHIFRKIVQPIQHSFRGLVGEGRRRDEDRQDVSW